jgi:hypothetical protein
LLQQAVDAEVFKLNQDGGTEMAHVERDMRAVLSGPRLKFEDDLLELCGQSYRTKVADNNRLKFDKFGINLEMQQRSSSLPKSGR